LSTKRMSSPPLTHTILTIQSRHQEVRSCQTTARSQEIRKTDSSSKDQTEGDGQEIFPGQGTRCQEEYVLSTLNIVDFADETERSEGAELGDEFDIDIDNSEDKPQRGGASARGARGRGGKTSVSSSIHLLLPFCSQLHSTFISGLPFPSLYTVDSRHPFTTSQSSSLNRVFPMSSLR